MWNDGSAVEVGGPYPRTFEADRELAESLGVEYLLAPRYDEIYADGRDVSFTAHLVGHRADWRPALQFMLNAFPEFFSAPDPDRTNFGRTLAQVRRACFLDLFTRSR